MTIPCRHVHRNSFAQSIAENFKLRSSLYGQGFTATNMVYKLETQSRVDLLYLGAGANKRQRFLYQIPLLGSNPFLHIDST